MLLKAATMGIIIVYERLDKSLFTTTSIVLMVYELDWMSIYFRNSYFI